MAVYLALDTAPAPQKTETLRAHIDRTHRGALTLNLELVTTPEGRERGLMNRTSLQPYDGMAFFFPRVAPQYFWMKNTLIPLDILFIDQNRRIVTIARGEPFSEARLGSNGPIETVIELDAGRAAKDGIAVGDVVHYETKVPPSQLAR